MKRKTADNPTGTGEEFRRSNNIRFLRRCKNTLLAVGLGVLLAQVVFFVINLGSVIIWYDSILFIGYLVICGVMGFVAGDRFIERLRIYIDDWWDPKSLWH